LPVIDGSNLTGIDAVVVGTTLPNPVSPEGSLFYKSDTDIFYISNGTQWNLVSNASPATTGGTVTIGAVSEGGTFTYDLGTDFTDDVDTDGELTYTKVLGTLPSGCTLPTTGNSAFTGTASGVSSNTNYTFTIKVTDTSGGTATQNYQQTINTVAATTTGGTVAITGAAGGTAISYDVDANFTFATGSTFSAYSLASGTLPSGTTLNASTGVISGTAGNSGSYSFTIRATDTDGDTADQSYSWSITAPVGQSEYTNPGTYSWVAPAGVTSVSVVAVGGGGAGLGAPTVSSGGGGLGWKNNIAVVPGSTYSVVVGARGTREVSDGAWVAAGDSYFINTSTVKGGFGFPDTTLTGLNQFGGGGTFTGDGGGNGGNGAWGTGGAEPGGGGAGGYSGTGGTGGYSDNTTWSTATDGSGGGGGGGQSGDFSGGGGGGVGIYGAGSSGTAGVFSVAPKYGDGGNGGSGGTSGINATDNGSDTITWSYGGDYGGGGFGRFGNDGNSYGAHGAVRIIWGDNRSFPSTGTANQ